MKRVRVTVAMFLLLTAYILTSELYQSYCWSFQEQFYFIIMGEKQNRKAAIELLEETSNDKNVGLFAIKKQEKSTLSTYLDVYATELAANNLKAEYDIDTGSYTSLFSGTTKIQIHTFSEVIDDESIENFYFMGSMDDVYSVKSIVVKQYDLSNISKIENANNNWVPLMIWGIAFCVLLMLGWLVIQIQKKENFVKISMGMSARDIILKNICSEILFYIFIIIGIKIVLGYFISLNYCSYAIVNIFMIFLILQIFINIIGFRYDYKEVMYGANVSIRALGNCYGIKIVSMMVAVISLAICVGLILYNYKYYNMYEEIDEYKEYSFLSYRVDVSDQKDDEHIEELLARKEAKIFFDMYEKERLAIATTNIIGLNGESYFTVTKETVGIKELIKEKVTENFHGVYILIPDNRMNKEDIAKSAFEAIRWNCEGFEATMEYEIITYDTYDLLYFNSRVSSLEFGFEKEKDPVMLMYSFDLQGAKRSNLSIFLEGIQHDIMYKLDGMEPEELEEIYGLKDVIITSVPERCREHYNTITRVILLNIIICVAMIWLEIIVISTIVKMEYVVNAKELAVKKILGYSIFRKNGFLIITNMISAICAIVSVYIYVKVYNIIDCSYLMLSSVILIVMEMIFIYRYVIKIENVQVTKILKGGSL